MLIEENRRDASRSSLFFSSRVLCAVCRVSCAMCRVSCAMCTRHIDGCLVSSENIANLDKKGFVKRRTRRVFLQFCTEATRDSPLLEAESQSG